MVIRELKQSYVGFPLKLCSCVCVISFFLQRVQDSNVLYGLASAGVRACVRACASFFTYSIEAILKWAHMKQTDMENICKWHKLFDLLLVRWKSSRMTMLISQPWISIFQHNEIYTYLQWHKMCALDASVKQATTKNSYHTVNDQLIFDAIALWWHEKCHSLFRNLTLSNETTVFK